MSVRFLYFWLVITIVAMVVCLVCAGLMAYRGSWLVFTQCASSAILCGVSIYTTLDTIKTVKEIDDLTKRLERL